MGPQLVGECQPDDSQGQHMAGTMLQHGAAGDLDPEQMQHASDSQATLANRRLMPFKWHKPRASEQA